MINGLFRPKQKFRVKTEADLRGKKVDEIKEYTDFLGKNIEEHKRTESAFYMPREEESLKGIKTGWRRYSPDRFYEKVWLGYSPATYLLWKLPPETHRKLNEVLRYANTVAAKNPTALAVTGTITGISHVLYGLKNKGRDSGKHVASGLAKIVGSTENDPKMKKVGSKTRRFIEDYLINFKPEQAVA